MKETAFISFKRYLQSINWVVLIFLVLVLNVKLPVKIAALLIISLINRKKLFNRQILSQGIIIFYFSMISLVIIHLLLYLSSVSFPYLIAATMSAGLWFMAAAAVYHIFIFINEGDIKKLHNTLTLFFMMNVAFILFSFLLIVFETEAINPYMYKGLNQKYFMNTGDFIRGITLDNPVSTAVISSFGIIYFLYQRKFFLSLITMTGFLLLGSNLTNFVLLGILVFIFCFSSDKDQKSIIIILVILGVVFMEKVSPNNFEYSGRWVYKLAGKKYDLPKKDNSVAALKDKPDSLLSLEDKRKKSALLYIDNISSVQEIKKGRLQEIAMDQIPVARKDSQLYIYKEPPNLIQKVGTYQSFIDRHFTSSEIGNIQKNYDWERPGKWIGAVQIIKFFKDHPEKVVLGNGAGNFSSRVAFKATGLSIAGGYPEKFRYVNTDFKNNHLYVYLHYRLQNEVKHSAINIPDSVYAQLLSEYGIAGLLCFIVFYAGYFLKRIRYLTYGLPILLLMAAAFTFEYWFELLSVVILFELMLLINIKESSVHDPQ